MTDPVGGEGWEARRRDLQDAVARHVLRYDSDFLPFFIERAEGAYLFDAHATQLADSRFDKEGLDAANATLSRLQQFWSAPQHSGTRITSAA